MLTKHIRNEVFSGHNLVCTTVVSSFNLFISNKTFHAKRSLRVYRENIRNKSMKVTSSQSGDVGCLHFDFTTRKTVESSRDFKQFKLRKKTVVENEVFLLIEKIHRNTPANNTDHLHKALFGACGW